MLPHQDVPVGVATSKQAAIGAPGERRDLMWMQECLGERADVEIPEMNRLIRFPTCGKRISIGSKGHTGEIAGLQIRPEQGTAGNVPPFDRVIPTSRYQTASIRAEGECSYSFHVGFPHLVQDLAFLVPDPHFP